MTGKLAQLRKDARQRAGGGLYEEMCGSCAAWVRFPDVQDTPGFGWRVVPFSRTTVDGGCAPAPG